MLTVSSPAIMAHRPKAGKASPSPGIPARRINGISPRHQQPGITDRLHPRRRPSIHKMPPRRRIASAKPSFAF
ncbi:hypothetical protein CSOJ01_05435 [Colletotrichum sojae]|uniref:Uncharacterized protein n=1 Tax=Colletotrichum sojae TaxID=2175907 RepID=A0A8H6MWW7_9PEZI|nr:hypothetical protein CSOJ01_05435 [Colletotrichum sojae]